MLFSIYVAACTSYIYLTCIRDLAEFGMGFNGGGGGGPPIMSREEFEARKANIRHKRDLERGGGRY